LTNGSGQYVLPAPQGQSTFTLFAYDAYTGQVVFKSADMSMDVLPGGITSMPVITDDHTPPFPQAAAPFSVLPFQVTKLSDSVTNLVGYRVTDQNGDGVASAGDSVQVTGAPGAASAGQPVAVLDLSTPEQGPVTVTASADGSFALTVNNLHGNNPGDILILSIGRDLVDPQAPIEVTFSRPVDTSTAAKPLRVEKRGSDGSWREVAGTPRFTADRRIVSFNPPTAWQAGATYRVSFPALKDDAGDVFPSGLTGQFKIKGDILLGLLDSPLGTVHAMARAGSLLFVAAPVKNGNTETPGILVTDVSKPDAPQLLSFVQTPYTVNGLAVTRVPKPVEGHCPQSDPQNLLPVLVAVGGGSGFRGTISGYQIVGSPPYLNPLGSNGLCCALGEYCEDDRGDPLHSGSPFQTVAIGQFAFVSTLGVGVQSMDLTTLCQPSNHGVIPGRARRAPFPRRT